MVALSLGARDFSRLSADYSGLVKFPPRGREWKVSVLTVRLAPEWMLSAFWRDRIRSSFWGGQRLSRRGR